MCVWWSVGASQQVSVGIWCFKSHLLAPGWGHWGTDSPSSVWGWLRSGKLLQQPSPSQTWAKTLFRARKTLCLRSRALHCSNSERGKSTCPWFPSRQCNVNRWCQHLAPNRWGEQNRGWLYQMDICVFLLSIPPIKARCLGNNPPVTGGRWRSRCLRETHSPDQMRVWMDACGHVIQWFLRSSNEINFFLFFNMFL